jgi:hypothetical protein
MILDLVDHIEVNRNYPKSDLLQIIHILNNYQLFRGHQMDLFGDSPKRKRRKAE